MAFVVGWVGAILCMAQVWYIGPIAKLVGEYGADVRSQLPLLRVYLLTVLDRWVIMLAFRGPHSSSRRSGGLSFVALAGDGLGYGADRDRTLSGT